jgi:hypothetical protein
MKSVQEQVHEKLVESGNLDEVAIKNKVKMGWGLEAGNVSRGFRQVFGLKHVYAGTANVNDVAKRRAKNKVARKSRRANR